MFASFQPPQTGRRQSSLGKSSAPAPSPLAEEEIVSVVRKRKTSEEDLSTSWKRTQSARDRLGSRDLDQEPGGWDTCTVMRGLASAQSVTQPLPKVQLVEVSNVWCVVYASACLREWV